VAFNATGTRLATGGLGGQILIWSVTQHSVVRQLPGHDTAVMSVHWGADGDDLISLGYDQAVRFWSTEGWGLTRELSVAAVPTSPLALSPEGGHMALGTAFRVLVYTLADGELVQELPVKAKGLYSVAFSPDGRWLALAAADKRLRIWERV
jgi:WD40 repeat protein